MGDFRPLSRRISEKKVQDRTKVAIELKVMSACITRSLLHVVCGDSKRRPRTNLPSKFTSDKLQGSALTAFTIAIY